MSMPPLDLSLHASPDGVPKTECLYAAEDWPRTITIADALQVLKDLDALESLDVIFPENSDPEIKERSVKKLSVEEKKRRNRECMRRLRNQRNELILTMRDQVQSLNAQLKQKLKSLGRLRPDEANYLSSQETQYQNESTENQVDSNHAPPGLTGSTTPVIDLIRKLREENYWLQKQLAQKSESIQQIQQLVQMREEECPPIDPRLLNPDDMGIWIRSTSHFVQKLDDCRTFEIVMDSYWIIQQAIQIANQSLTTPNLVLGWSDQRAVDNEWANFRMQKTFPHQSARDLAMKTWKMHSTVREINVLQPMVHGMKIVQRLNEFTLVIARQLSVRHTNSSYCMLYLLFLLETPDGFVVGSRSLDPDLDKMQPFTHDRLTVARPFHCYHFRNPEDGSSGCTFSLSGRVDCQNPLYPHLVAMDMLLTAMRWESHCVAPLWCLGQ